MVDHVAQPVRVARRRRVGCRRAHQSRDRSAEQRWPPKWAPSSGRCASSSGHCSCCPSERSRNA